jgi:uncharacterized protein YwgA
MWVMKHSGTKGDKKMATKLRNCDVTLLIIAAAGDTGLTPIQIMKSVFLVGKCGLPDLPSDFYHFIAYNYGPFHPDVYRDVEMLVNVGLVLGIRETGRNWLKYIIAPSGLRYAEELRRQVAHEFSDYANEVVKWVQSLTFSQLLQAIYAKYPEMRENSVFQEV